MTKDVCHWENGKLIRCSKNTVKTIKDPFCRHCGMDLKKPPVEIVPGVFGKFWEGKKYSYGFLERIEEELFVDQLGDYWNDFKPGFPPGVNPDGTPAG